MAGMGYEEIARKTGRSAGVISKVVNEKKGSYPELTILRKLKQQLGSEDPADVLRNVVILNALKELGFDSIPQP